MGQKRPGAAVHGALSAAPPTQKLPCGHERPEGSTESGGQNLPGRHAQGCLSAPPPLQKKVSGHPDPFTAAPPGARGQSCPAPHSPQK